MMSGFNTTFNENNLIKQEEINNNPAFKYYFQDNLLLNDELNLDKNNENMDYAESKLEELNCNFFENYGTIYLLAVIAPILYILTLLCIIYFFCKKKKIINQYEKIHIKNDTTSVIEDNQIQQIELEITDD